MTPLAEAVLDLRALLDEDKSTPVGDGKWKLGDKIGVWRTIFGRRVFFPDGSKRGQGISGGKPFSATKALASFKKAGGKLGGALKKALTPAGLKKGAKAVAHAVAEPFHKMWKLATSKEERKNTWAFIKKTAAKETQETKALFGTLKKAVTGETVSRKERTAAMHQVADLVKAALIASTVAHLAAGGVAKLAAVALNPADELAAAVIDKPLRMATKKVFGQAHGLLPSAFYESLVEAAADEMDLLQKLVDAVMDELAAAGPDLDALAAVVKPA